MRRAFIVSPKGIGDAGGVERVMRYAARSLRAEGYRVVVVDRARLLASVWGRPLSRAISSRFGFFFEAIGYSLYLGARKRHGDIVIGNGHTCAFRSADLLFNHGSMRGFRFAVQGQRLLYGPEELMEAFAGRLARRVVAVSARAGREWREFYKVDRAKIHILRNCVDTEHFRPLSQKKAKDGYSGAVGKGAADALESATPAPEGAGTPLRVIFVGRLGFAKGMDRLVALARSAYQNGVLLDIVIASPSADGLGTFAGETGLEIRVGVAFADLPELYGSCDVMYLPSRYEGFEMVTTEALACGIPVVGSNVGAIAELERIGFPGVKTVDADEPEEALRALGIAAKAWASSEKKRLLAENAKKAFGLEAWSGAFAALVREAADD